MKIVFLNYHNSRNFHVLKSSTVQNYIVNVVIKVDLVDNSVLEVDRFNA